MIFPYRNGYAAYGWVRTPQGERKKKCVYGKTREQVHDKWIALQGEARIGPMVTSSPTLAEYLSYWLDEIIKPNRAPLTYATYETFIRLHIIPDLGGKRLDRLGVRDLQKWINHLAAICQCCAQGKMPIACLDDDVAVPSAPVAPAPCQPNRSATSEPLCARRSPKLSTRN